MKETGHKISYKQCPSELCIAMAISTFKGTNTHYLVFYDHKFPLPFEKYLQQAPRNCIK